MHPEWLLTKCNICSICFVCSSRVFWVLKTQSLMWYFSGVNGTNGCMLKSGINYTRLYWPTRASSASTYWPGPDAAIRALRHFSLFWLAPSQLTLLLEHHRCPGGGCCLSGSSKHSLVPSRRHFHQGLSQNRGGKRSWCVFFFFFREGLSAGERRWPRARQTRRARPSSSRASTSNLTECGCRPSAGGRWRRSPTSPWEAATSGSSPTPSQVRLAPCTLHVHISLRENCSSRVMMKANVFFLLHHQH